MNKYFHRTSIPIAPERYIEKLFAPILVIVMIQMMNISKKVHRSYLNGKKNSQKLLKKEFKLFFKLFNSQND